MKTEIENKMKKMISNIAKVNVDFYFCMDGTAVVSWEGTSKIPYENLCKVLGSRVYDFDVDTEEGFTFAGCMINLNK